MKTLIYATLATALCTSAIAQPQRPAHAPPPAPLSLEAFSALQLTDTQMQQLDEVLVDQRIAKEALRQEMEAQLQTILTAEQFAEWQATRAQAPRARSRSDRGGPRS